MNKLTKIGVSALCGSLAAVASAHAGSMSVSGGATATYTSNEGSVTGNPIGLSSGITFSGSGELDNGWSWEISANYGRFEQDVNRTGQVINDRFFAAIDAVTDPATGQPACRADVNPSAPAMNTPFQIPSYEAGYFSFTPGAGTCVPINIWAGQGAVTSAAHDWVTTPTWDELELEQTVIAASLVGDTEEFVNLPGGPIGFATGIEWREEESTAKFDPWQLGVIPSCILYTSPSPRDRG